jgi:hypothetical protein
MRYYTLESKRLSSRIYFPQANPEWKKLEDYVFSLFTKSGFTEVKPSELTFGCVTKQYPMLLPSGEGIRVDVAAILPQELGGHLILLECKCQNRGGGASRAEIIALGQKLPHLDALSWVVCQGTILNETLISQCSFYSPSKNGFQGITRIEAFSETFSQKTGIFFCDSKVV